MLSMKEMFYGEVEPVWILKPEKEDKKSDDENSEEDKKSGSNSEEEAQKADYSILASIPYYPYYYPDYVAPAPAKKVDPKKETKVVLKVPICGECEQAVTVALKQLKGVKSVECDTRKEKVTVVATTVGAADILMECQKVFKKSRFWKDDD